MSKIYEGLGRKVWKYRKENNISTENFAKSIGVSGGLVNHIENAKYDVFKLELLSSIISKLGIPPGEILPLYDINSDVQFDLGTQDAEATEYCKQQMKLIINSFMATISEYGCTLENVSIISNHIQQEFETLIKLHRANR
ncbi:helix-turn-helix transcriptional regulator [Alkaliphilus hydrothermalis]|uniref:Transcriptional regulator with XRE-family HTH domain n=1 Tax=Alkaliphilus hydrothermalis TaxID=1482730 RepID=A0ABS2NRY9_9FIRM|nr:helix-turn-helix transcriptional regulator [Alkaliphilus hydrothermalis]MBM7615739.1 transcriptional regulator with XRE-family HTH domain [Alkaliphilus hydrothermalis]